MACDSCWSSLGTQTVSLTKIHRLSSGALLGQAGDNDSRAIIQLLDKIKDPRKLPSRAELANTKVCFEGLLALQKGGVWVIATGKHDSAGYPEDNDDDFGVWPATTMGGYAAVGSGSDHALCAMDAGATAKEAVVIACRRNVYCRLPVHVVKLAPGGAHVRRVRT
jgi:hypothetical protein